MTRGAKHIRFYARGVHLNKGVLTKKTVKTTIGIQLAKITSNYGTSTYQ